MFGLKKNNSIRNERTLSEFTRVITILLHNLLRKQLKYGDFPFLNCTSTRHGTYPEEYLRHSISSKCIAYKSWPQ